MKTVPCNGKTTLFVLFPSGNFTAIISLKQLTKDSELALPTFSSQPSWRANHEEHNTMAVKLALEKL
jgi:hypothetical protein